MPLRRMLEEEKDSLHQTYSDEIRNIHRLALENLKRVLDEQEKVNTELEIQKKKFDLWNRELNKRNDMQKQNKSLQMASIEQEKADKSVRRLFEVQKREKEEVLKKLLELEKQLDAKQKLEMEVEDLKGKLQVMKHLGDEDDDAFQEKIKKMNNEMKSKMEEMDDMENLNQTLAVMERQSNHELQEARKAFRKSLQGMRSGRTNREEMTNELVTKMLMTCTIRKSSL